MKLYLEDNEDLPAPQILEDSDPAPSGYTDFSQDLTKWKRFGLQCCSDYLQFREYVNQQLDIKTWENLSNEEKDFVITLSIKENSKDDSTASTEKITYLITTGQIPNDPSQGRTFLINKWAKHHVKERESTKNRIACEALYSVVGNYLSHDDAARFFISVENLFAAFENQVIRGSQDGLEVDALFDYIESTTGSVYENAGLSAKGYTMQNGDADASNFIIDLMNILRNGNY